jgi:hypothetical protein
MGNWEISPPLNHFETSNIWYQSKLEKLESAEGAVAQDNIFTRKAESDGRQIITREDTDGAIAIGLGGMVSYSAFLFASSCD